LVLLDSLSGVQCHLVVGLVTVLKTLFLLTLVQASLQRIVTHQVVILEVDIKVASGGQLVSIAAHWVVTGTYG
jgi:hypothetical protein